MEADPIIKQINLSSEDVDELKRLVKEGYIRRSIHPTLPLSIYNYSTKTQFEQFWTPTTRMSRGLVLDNTYDIVIKCVPKFFNQGEELAAKVNLTNARISEKLDGVLIQVKLDSDWGLIITSRGSFDNKYIEAAKQFITDEAILKVTPNYTYFCELLQNFPGDEAIILTQHPVPKLVCWAIKDENFNEIIPDEECPFPIAQELSLAEAKLYLKQKVEGIVAQDLKTKERIKLKSEWFIKNHRLISDCTKKRLWEILSEGGRVQDLDIPDEFMPQMKEWQQELLLDFNLKVANTQTALKRRANLSDKEIALDNTLHPALKSYLFTLKKRGLEALSTQIWKDLKPKMV